MAENETPLHVKAFGTHGKVTYCGLAAKTVECQARGSYAPIPAMQGL